MFFSSDLRVRGPMIKQLHPVVTAMTQLYQIQVCLHDPDFKPHIMCTVRPVVIAFQ